MFGEAVKDFEHVCLLMKLGVKIMGCVYIYICIWVDRSIDGYKYRYRFFFHLDILVRMLSIRIQAFCITCNTILVILPKMTSISVKS